MSQRIKHFYEFGPFRLDATERLLLRDGQHIPLTPKAFETLLTLVENSGHVIEKDELIKKIWPDTFVEEVNLARNVYSLRKVLGGEQATQYIETIPKRGYRFVASVREVRDEHAESVMAPQPLSHFIDQKELLESGEERFKQDVRWEQNGRPSLAGALPVLPRSL